jgi:hypothetical protein
MIRGKVAVVNRTGRLALIASIVVIASQLAVAQAADKSPSAASEGKELRSGSLDVVLLLDKSLSMASCFEEAKNYAAGNVLGAILIPGDRLIVETVYGKVDRLVTATISSEEDKAKAIRAIRQVKADGKFTDLGAALDAAKKDLDELGQNDRPKYVLLITDERQEAPKGSPYQATDYKLKHPSLAYVKRLDLGKFRAITVGLHVADKVNAATPGVMQLLMDPPVRDAKAIALAAGADGKASTGGAKGGSTDAERALPAWLLFGAAVLFLIAIAGVIIVLFVSKRHKEEEKRSEAKS